jgi:hypothetical protein
MALVVAVDVGWALPCAPSGPMVVVQVATRACLFLWDNFVHGCILGLILFVAVAWLLW